MTAVDSGQPVVSDSGKFCWMQNPMRCSVWGFPVPVTARCRGHLLNMLSGTTAELSDNPGSNVQPSGARRRKCRFFGSKQGRSSALLLAYIVSIYTMSYQSLHVKVIYYFCISVWCEHGFPWGYSTIKSHSRHLSLKGSRSMTDCYRM